MDARTKKAPGKAVRHLAREVFGDSLLAQSSVMGETSSGATLNKLNVTVHHEWAVESQITISVYSQKCT